MIRTSLRQYLAAQSNIAALVGERIYPVVLPQSAAFPALTYSRTSGGHDYTLKGSSGMAMPTFELDCWGETYDAADELAEAIRLKLNGFNGTMGDTEVKVCVLDDEVDAFEPNDDASAEGVYRITLRYRIQYTESVPAL